MLLVSRNLFHRTYSHIVLLSGRNPLRVLLWSQDCHAVALSRRVHLSEVANFPNPSLDFVRLVRLKRHSRLTERIEANLESCTIVCAPQSRRGEDTQALGRLDTPRFFPLNAHRRFI